MSQLDSIFDQKYQGSPSFLLFVELTYLREECINNFIVILIVQQSYQKAALFFLQATSFIRRFSREWIVVYRFHDRVQEFYRTYVFIFIFLGIILYQF